MGRQGLLIALVLAALVGGLFALFPDLDIRIAALAAHGDGSAGRAFTIGDDPLVGLFRRLWYWISTAFVLACVGAVVLKLIRPSMAMLLPGRAVIFLLASIVLAPGLVANAVLKEHWGRPRPVQITQFGGADHFVPWWDPRGACPRNCSFVSGEVAGSFWMLAPASLAPAPWRPLAYGAALAFGAAMGAMRMLAGAHFFSDVFFAAFFTFVIVWLCHAAVYRWSSITDDDVECRIADTAATLTPKVTAAVSAMRDWLWLGVHWLRVGFLFVVDRNALVWREEKSREVDRNS